MKRETPETKMGEKITRSEGGSIGLLSALIRGKDGGKEVKTFPGTASPASPAAPNVPTADPATEGLAPRSRRPGEIAPCAQPHCAGCYDVGEGRLLHPPKSGQDFLDWLLKWEAKGRVQ